jgi:hypothetical protein
MMMIGMIASRSWVSVARSTIIPTGISIRRHTEDHKATSGSNIKSTVIIPWIGPPNWSWIIVWIAIPIRIGGVGHIDGNLGTALCYRPFNIFWIFSILLCILLSSL